MAPSEHAQQLGWSAYCDEGANVARGDFLLFLSPDAMLPRGAYSEDSELFSSEWIDEFRKLAKKQNETVIFSPKILDREGLHPLHIFSLMYYYR